MVTRNIGSKSISLAKVCLGLACLTALCGTVGCSGKNESDAKTPQEIQDFRGHQPTPEQLQAAMNRTKPQPAGQTTASKP